MGTYHLVRNRSRWTTTQSHHHREPFDSFFELRLLCSYGGEIEYMHASALEYRGGENRLVTVDRRWSAAELLNHLSDTFFAGQSLILKYHFPVSGSRSLVSVATDEDLRHMIEEHDRLAFSAEPRCLRALLFPKDQEESVKPLVLRDDKLRLMCKYGGQFYFHPRRDIQSYIGGHTRVIVMDRASSLSNLCSQISLELFNGCKMTSFTLKYKRPKEAVDCLISLATDQDLHIMMELYNYLSSRPPKKYDHYDSVSLPKQFHLHLFVLDAETQVALPLQDDSSPPSLPINSTSSEDRPSNQPGESTNLIGSQNPSKEPVPECRNEIVPSNKDSQTNLSERRCIPFGFFTGSSSTSKNIRERGPRKVTKNSVKQMIPPRRGRVNKRYILIWRRIRRIPIHRLLTALIKQ